LSGHQEPWTFPLPAVFRTRARRSKKEQKFKNNFLPFIYQARSGRNIAAEKTVLALLTIGGYKTAMWLSCFSTNG
jgi:hypothetical protein